MSKPEEEPWKEALDKVVRSFQERIESIESEIGAKFSALDQKIPSSGKREGENVSEEKKLYKCKGKDCGFATDDIDTLIDHVVNERLREREQAPERFEPPKTHRTVKEYLECPECYPKFEKAILENPRFLEALKARGYVKTEKKEGLTL